MDTHQHEHYDLHVTTKAVEASATRPIPFEVKGWTRQFRDALRAGVDALPSGQPLDVQVWDAKRWIHDLENAAIYNVGPAAFSRFLLAGLRLRRAGESFLPTATLTGGPVAAQYAYRITAPLPRLVGETPTVRWSFPVPNPITVTAVWTAARPALCEVDRAELPGRIGLRIAAPKGLTGGAIKPLLDGIVAAMHTAIDPDLADRVLQEWRAAPNLRGLTRSGPAPLGPRRLITMAGSRPSWNPADDLVDELVIWSRGGTSTCDVIAFALPADRDEARRGNGSVTRISS